MNRLDMRRRAEAMIEELIDLINAIDGDPDREDDGIAEPWLGWCKGGGGGNSLDLEENDQDSRDKLPMIDLGAL